jgi:hypothetical protein
MSAVRCLSRSLRGLSFEIADLMLIRQRSAANNLRMVVQLDHGSDVTEYEEVIALYSGTSSQWRWMMWRNASAVFLRSIDGRSRRYKTAGHAIEALLRKQRGALTNIKVTYWLSA